MTNRPDRIVHLDSLRLRTLAHPLRSRLLAALRMYGPGTSTELAGRLETNSGATSYHLRKLAEVGLVEDDPDRGVGRERWWRSAHDITSWVESDFIDDPDDRAAADWLYVQYVRAKSAWVNDWLAVRDQWSKEWRDASDSSDLRLDLTAAQLQSLNEELREVLVRYNSHSATADQETQPVMVLIETFPAPEPRV